MADGPFTPERLAPTLDRMDLTKRDPSRRCSAPGCSTLLSLYNSDHLCFVHGDERSRTAFERVSETARRYQETSQAPSTIRISD